MTGITRSGNDRNLRDTPFGWVPSAEADSLWWRLVPALTCRANFWRRYATVGLDAVRVRTRDGTGGSPVPTFRLHAKQIGFDFRVALLVGPEVEGGGGNFVDHRIGQAVLCEVDGLQILFAAIAALDANVVEVLSAIDPELAFVFFSASGADDAAELPLSEAEGTQ